MLNVFVLISLVHKHAGHAHARADAHAGEGHLGLAAAEFREHRDDLPGTGAAEGMTDCTKTSVSTYKKKRGRLTLLHLGR